MLDMEYCCFCFSLHHNKIDQITATIAQGRAMMKREYLRILDGNGFGLSRACPNWPKNGQRKREGNYCKCRRICKKYIASLPENFMAAIQKEERYFQ